MNRADGYADQMRQAGRSDKSDAIEEAAFAGRQFRPVSVAVEQPEHIDKRRGGDERRTPLGQDGRAKQLGSVTELVRAGHHVFLALIVGYLPRLSELAFDPTEIFLDLMILQVGEGERAPKFAEIDASGVMRG